MNKAKINEQDYINFIVATQMSYSCLEAGRVQPESANAAAHDAFTRLLQRLEPDATALWQESEPQVDKTKGVLVLDDTTLDKPYAKKMALVTRHWSGKHHAVVQGINLLTLLWTDGERYLPCDYRLYDKASDGLSKNDHFRAMVQTAHERGFRPECVVFDSWYSGLDNLKHLRGLGFRWLTRLKSNRLVNPDGKGQRSLADVPLREQGTQVHLQGYGLILVFKIVATDGDIEYWATDDLHLHELTRLRFAEYAWQIETYPRGIKQFCGLEKSQARLARTQRNHIGLALRAFLRLETFCFYQGISWFEAKTAIIRHAVATYLANPWYALSIPTA
jgi:putative transposase